MLKVLMLSRWHVHAAGYAKALLATGKVKITAVWDEDPARGAAWAAELGTDFEADLARAVSRPDVDAVVCDAPTSLHARVLTAAANAKKHIFTEKAMALTTAECREIAKAVRENGVTFVISLPQRFRPVIGLARKLMDDGVFGKISLVRFRDAHSGVSARWLPEYWYDNHLTGGGALMDLGCHPLYLSAYLLGQPKRIQAMMTKPFGSAMSDEYAVATMEFENGALAIAETALVSYRAPQSVEIFGSDGVLLDFGQGIRVNSAKFGEVVYANPPAAGASPIEQFVDACLNQTGSPSALGLDDGILLTRLLEAAYLSEREQRTVSFFDESI